MDFDSEELAIARTRGITPATRRLQLGMSAIIGRPDGAVVELFPDGREVILHGPTDSAKHPESVLAEDLDGPNA